MVITLDTSTLLAVLLNEPTKTKILKMTVGSELIAPSSLIWEMGNALSALMKRKKLNLKQAVNVAHQAEKVPIQFVEPSLEVSLEFCHKHQIYAYDSYMLTVASQYRAPLFTLDSALQNIAKKEKINLLEL